MESMEMRKKVIILILIVITITSIISIFRLKAGKSNTVDIIDLYNNYYDRFSAVASFLTEDRGYLYVDYSPQNFIIEYIKADGSKDSKTGNKRADSDILYLVNKLGFKGIYEDKEQISFVKELGSPEKGIVYMKNKKIPSGPEKVEKLKENWYYYQETKE